MNSHHNRAQWVFVAIATISATGIAFAAQNPAVKECDKVLDGGAKTNDGGGIRLYHPTGYAVWQQDIQDRTINFCVRAGVNNAGADPIKPGATLSLTDSRGNPVRGATNALPVPPVGPKRAVALKEPWCVSGFPGKTLPDLQVVLRGAVKVPAPSPTGDPACAIPPSPPLPADADLRKALGLPSRATTATPKS